MYKHGAYVRLLDNGPRYAGRKATTRDLMNDPVIQAILDRHGEEVAEVRREMAEWRQTH